MADRSTSRTARYRSAEKAPIGGGIRGAAVKWVSAHHRCRQPSERSREVVKGKPDRERLAAGGHHLQIRAWPLARFSTVLRSSLQRITQPFRIQIIERRPDGGRGRIDPYLRTGLKKQPVRKRKHREDSASGVGDPTGPLPVCRLVGFLVASQQHLFERAVADCPVAGPSNCPVRLMLRSCRRALTPDTARVVFPDSSLPV